MCGLRTLPNFPLFVEMIPKNPNNARTQVKRFEFSALSQLMVVNAHFLCYNKSENQCRFQNDSTLTPTSALDLNLTNWITRTALPFPAPSSANSQIYHFLPVPN